MFDSDTSNCGAKVQSWSPANPRAILKNMIEGNPSLDKHGLFDLFLAGIKSKEFVDHFDTVVEYWFANNYLSLIGPPPATDQEGADNRRRAVDEIKKKIEANIQREAQIALLDMMMPNGKALRDCTGNECSALSGKVGRWLEKVAEWIKPDAFVGGNLTEDQLRKIYAD